MKQEEEVHFTIVSTLYSLTDKLTVGYQEELVGVENEGDTSSCKMVLQLKLQRRRTREELVNQGIMPPLKSSASFHEQRRSLERARTEDYLKRKIRCRPERSELVRMHILEETSAEPSLQAKQLLLKRARLAVDLNDKISQRPGPMELIHKNILPLHSTLKQAIIDTEFPKVVAESSSFDEESSDAFSPEQVVCPDSSPGSAHLPSPPEILASETIPKQVTPPPPPPPLLSIAEPAPHQKLANGAGQKQAFALQKGGSKASAERTVQRTKKVRDNKPKVKKLKYHQYVPPDQKAERDPPPLLDSSYAKLLCQQQLFLQLQIINQQQQNYNYHTILPAPPKPPADQQPASSNGSSPSKNAPPSHLSSTNSAAPHYQITSNLVKIGSLPPNLDELKVAELKQELKLRGLTVSGTKNDLIERLKNFHEQISGSMPTSKNHTMPQQPPDSAPAVGGASSPNQSTDSNVAVTSLPFATVERGGAKTTTPQSMQFGSTSSSPPVSPTHSERSLAGMSPDEMSYNGDAFGEIVTSPLTQLTLQPSSPFTTTVHIKDEHESQVPVTCCLGSQPTAPPMNKDQMLQEKDRHIQELTRMLLQKQQLVETLRSQLEGKRVGVPVRVKEEPAGVTMETVTVKKEVIEVQEESEMVTEPWVFPQAGQTQMLQQRMQTAVELDQERQQQLVLQQNQRNLQQQVHQRKRKTQKHSVMQAKPTLQKQQVSQSDTNQQSSPVSSLTLDILKSNSAPTIVTDSNGNQFLLTLSNQNAEAPARVHLSGKTTNDITLQRLQSTPNRPPSRSVAELTNNNNQSKEPVQTVILKQPIKKALKPALKVSNNYKKSNSASISTPANHQNFFSSVDAVSNTSPVPSSPNNSNEKMCLSLDQRALLSSPTSYLCSSTALGHQENGCNRHGDDLFDILIQRGDISENFKASPDPVLEHLRPNTPLSLNPSHLNVSAPPCDVPQTLVLEPQRPRDASRSSDTGTGRLEDFLESTTGKPLLGVEPGGPMTLIVDLHNQMLSTPSILDHTCSPMDTCDLGFSSHSPSDLVDSVPDSMDWIDFGMSGPGGEGLGIMNLNGHAPSSLFSADFLDTSDLNWSSL
ncbi:myocardin-related transcription factor A isoform X3 [Triplophysa dalaica]|uniref:myocardin-related transcription factor A isoform X3 n=1 Tax=Triplophysa dalaica TaxID=1582913 RepID=UPI0024E010EE|nr:myocardin-related transcription factor A isoform X3 [Triplophysa dalaica]